MEKGSTHHFKKMNNNTVTYLVLLIMSLNSGLPYYSFW
jgi:hypothetical protein